MKENQPAKSKILISLLLFLVLLFSYSISGFIGAQKATSAHAYSCSGTVLCDPYTRFSGYDSYLESFYQATQPIPGFRAYPIQDPSGGDYCNYWMDDAGKMLSAFAYLGDAQYATYASSFIMNNAIQQDGFYYLPERYVQGCSTYLHVNRTQLASPTYPISFGPVQNPSFELTNTINNQLLYWNTAASGSGTQRDIENSPGICADGSFCVATQASGSPGMAAYVQPVGGTTAFIFAHNDPAIGINGGIIGNFTASFLPVARQTSQSASSTNQMVFGYDSFPALSYDTVIPANSAFSLAAYVSANVSLTGVTFGVQVNEVCNNYGKETSPWGGRGHKHCFNRDSAGAIQRIRANGAKRRNRSCRMCLSFHRLLESKYDTSVHVHNILGLKKPRGLCLLSLVYSTRRSLQRALIVRNSH